MEESKTEILSDNESIGVIDDVPLINESIGVIDDVPLIPLDYVPSLAMALSEGLTSYMEGSQDLLAELSKPTNCCLYFTLEHLCAMDRTFAGQVRDDRFLSFAIRQLKEGDASELFVGPVRSPLDAEMNAVKKFALRFVSFSFDNRVDLIKKKKRFLEILLEHLVQGMEDFIAHQVELKGLIISLEEEMQAFYAQLPTVAPKKIGNFKNQRKLMDSLMQEMEVLGGNFADARAAAEAIETDAQDELEGGGSASGNAAE